MRLWMVGRDARHKEITLKNDIQYIILPSRSPSESIGPPQDTFITEGAGRCFERGEFFVGGFVALITGP